MELKLGWCINSRRNRTVAANTEISVKGKNRNRVMHYCRYLSINILFGIQTVTAVRCSFIQYKKDDIRILITRQRQSFIFDHYGISFL